METSLGIGSRLMAIGGVAVALASPAIQAWSDAAVATDVRRGQEMFEPSARAAGAVDPSYFGTWRLLVERSSFNGAAPPREAVRIVGDRHHGLISTVTHTVDLDGIVRDNAFVSRLDGRPYVISSPEFGPGATIVERLANRMTIEFVVTSGGSLVAEGTRTIRDGREMTIETHVLDGYGQEMTSTTIWERLPGFLD